jgi:hypothetical protein
VLVSIACGTSKNNGGLQALIPGDLSPARRCSWASWRSEVDRSVARPTQFHFPIRNLYTALGRQLRAWKKHGTKTDGLPTTKGTRTYVLRGLICVKTFVKYCFLIHTRFCLFVIVQLHRSALPSVYLRNIDYLNLVVSKHLPNQLLKFESCNTSAATVWYSNTTADSHNTSPSAHVAVSKRLDSGTSFSLQQR